MTHAQRYYLRTPQREFALEFKKLAPFLQDELNIIHRIQVLSGMLSRDYRDELHNELLEIKAQYEKTYGPYELNHYDKPKQEPEPPTGDPGEQLKLF